MHDLGVINYFIGVDVTHTYGAFHLIQHKYITYSNRDSHYQTNCFSHLSPTLSQFDGESFPNVYLYHAIVGVLQFVIITLLNLSFFVNKVYQFMYQPTISYCLVVKHILCYLRGSMHHGLLCKLLILFIFKLVQMQVRPHVLMIEKAQVVIVSFLV